MKRYMLSNIDTIPFYYSLGINEIYVFPQFEVFEELESGGDVMRYVFHDGRSIIYLKNTPQLMENLIAEIQNPNAPKYDAYDYMQHPLSDESYSKLFCISNVISEMLSIKCPQLEIRQDEKVGVYGSSIPEINLVNLYVDADTEETIIFMVRYLAHELRHLWQYINRPEYFDKPQDSKSMEEYMNSPEETDAEAFANKLFSDLIGIDTIRENPNYAGGDKAVTEKILKLQDGMEIDESIVERVRNVLLN